MSAFVGREDDLAKVDVLLRENSRVNIAAAVGMGGVGKTELALQYALLRGDAFPGGVCWLRGVEPIAPQMVSFARDYLGLEVPEQTENLVAWCCNRWPGAEDKNGAVLMVVDDVQDYRALKEMLPSPATGGGRFRVLLTTRQAVLPESQRLALEVLRQGAALELLTSLVGEGRIEAEAEAAESLCEWVGRLPLGIELVGWHLARRPELTVAKLLTRLEGKKLAAKALMKAHPEMTAKLGVAAAFEVSWEPLVDEAKTLAGLLGLFAAAPIDWAWVVQAIELSRWHEQAGEGLDEEDLEEGQKELLEVNLLKMKGEQGMRRYQVHPLVREFFAVKLGELAAAEALQRGFAQVMTEVAKEIPQAVTVAVRTQVTEAVPHMEAVAVRWSSVLEDDDKTWCCTGLGWLYESWNQWDDAERCGKRALEICRNELGEAHVETITSLNNLALVYCHKGCYRKAELLLVQAWRFCKAELGETHPNILVRSINALAELYRLQSRSDEAEILLVQALKLCKAKLDESCVDTAISLNNLALVYLHQGRYGEAEPLLVKALDSFKVEVGEDSASTMHAANNLAELYRHQGRYSEAEPLFLQSLETCRAELGENHSLTIQIINNLALVYFHQGRYGEAEPLLVQALDSFKVELGEDHPSTMHAANNLAELYRHQGRYSEAEPLFLQSLETCRAELGEHHPFIVQIINNLALVYYHQGRYSEAEPLFLQCVEAHRTKLGENDPSIIYSLNNLALLYYDTNRFSQASSSMSKALKLSEKKLGEDHPNTLSIRENLADLLFKITKANKGRCDESQDSSAQ